MTYPSICIVIESSEQLEGVGLRLAFGMRVRLARQPLALTGWWSSLPRSEPGTERDIPTSDMACWGLSALVWKLLPSTGPVGWISPEAAAG